MWVRGRARARRRRTLRRLDVDPDGTAIKAERTSARVPRLLAQANISRWMRRPRLRSTGFTVARKEQATSRSTAVGRQKTLRGRARRGVGGGLPQLHTEDVARGVRVEVWDDTTKVWRSLHARRTTARRGRDGLPRRRQGFIQRHERHRAPRGDRQRHPRARGDVRLGGVEPVCPAPGKRVRPVITDAPGGGSQIEERAETTPTTKQGKENPPHPFVFTHRFAEGTLPRLRFGRDYSFRAWAVDLGGNVRTHHVGPRPPRSRPSPRTHSGWRPSPTGPCPGGSRAPVPVTARPGLRVHGGGRGGTDRGGGRGRPPRRPGVRRPRGRSARQRRRCGRAGVANAGARATGPAPQSRCRSGG